jgi:hypothetical protein
MRKLGALVLTGKNFSLTKKNRKADDLKKGVPMPTKQEMINHYQ